MLFREKDSQFNEKICAIACGGMKGYAGQWRPLTGDVFNANFETRFDEALNDSLRLLPSPPLPPSHCPKKEGG